MSSEIEDFVSFLFEGYKKGFVYAPHRVPGKEWETQFFPVSKTADIVSYLDEMGRQADVYVAPTLFKVPNKGPAKKWLRDGSVIYVDLDGNAPEDIPSGIPEPGYRLKSSLPGREHWFWKLDNNYPPDSLEVYNRSLALALNADTSGFDATQVLRVPGTFNFKRSTPLPVEIISTTEEKYSAGQFAKIIVKSEKKIEKEELKTGKIPELLEAITTIAWSRPLLDRFQSTDVPEEGTRSDVLWGFTKDLLREGMSTEGAVAVVQDLSSRWYPEGRKLNTIKTDVAKAHGEIAEELTESGLFKITERPVKLMGFEDFMSSSEPEPSWLVENMIHEGHTGILASMPGVGKSVMGLHLAAHVATGKDFLQWGIPKPQKAAFISIEMGTGLTKTYVSKMLPHYGEERERLAENLSITAGFNAMDLLLSEKREQLLTMLEDNGVRFVVVDSLFGSVGRDYDKLTEYVNWISNELSERNIASWLLHHSTKGLEKAEQPGMDHVYGGVDLTAKVDSVLLMRSPIDNRANLEVFPEKIRGIDNPMYNEPVTLVKGAPGNFYLQADVPVGMGLSSKDNLKEAYDKHSKPKPKPEPEGQDKPNPFK